MPDYLLLFGQNNERFCFVFFLLVYNLPPSPPIFFGMLSLIFFLSSSLCLSPPLPFSPSCSTLFISSKWSKEYALFLKEQEKEIGKEERVGGFVKKRKIETRREEERRGEVWFGSPDDALAPTNILCVCLSVCGGSDQLQSLHSAPHTHTQIHTCTSTTISAQRYRQGPQSHGSFGGAGVFLRCVNEHGLLSFPL